MAVSYTYTTLSSALQSHMGDTGDIYVAQIPEMILLGESRVLKDLNLSTLDAQSNTITFTAGSQVVTKPDGWIATTMLMYFDGSRRVQLKRRTLEFVRDYNIDPTLVNAVPEYYAEVDATQWLIAKRPAVTVTNGICNYTKRPDSMTSSNATTWLGTNVGDLLLSACLIASSRWSKSDEALAAWKDNYSEQLASARKEFAHHIRKEG